MEYGPKAGVHFVEYSPKPELSETFSTDSIYLVQQFFIHCAIERYNEIKYVLKKNVENPFISKIFLLNERIYTNDELGLSQNEVEDKIVQVNIHKRLEFKDFFDFIETNGENAFYILSNSDIFYDEGVNNLRKTDIATKKAVFALNRKEYVLGKMLENCELRIMANSQDTWIIHSNFNLLQKDREDCKFFMGKNYCDNRICRIFRDLEYAVYNDPILISTYHYHTSDIRNYTSNEYDLVKGKMAFVAPITTFDYDEVKKNQPQNFSIGDNLKKRIEIEYKVYQLNSRKHILQKIRKR